MTLAKDDCYRVFSNLDDISDNLKKAVILYEDRYFYYHFGFNPFALTKAAFYTAMKKRRMGASTITMQLARSVYKIDTTTVFGKINQIEKALRIEYHYSKKEILEAYLNLVPYGHNIEGAGAASLIYFKKEAKNLTLPEALALAVIPQNPNDRTPTNENGLKEMEKARYRLSLMWKEKGYDFIDTANMKINVYKINDLPFLSPHYVQRQIFLNKDKNNIKTSLDIYLQKDIENIVSSYLDRNKNKKVNNSAVLLKNYKTNETVVYVGSANFFDNSILGQVDGITAYRSPGSAMKPFIYALGIEGGIIHPMSLMKDIPKQFGIYSPENFERGFMGAISATESLVESRNVPAVDLLLKLPKSSFYNLLKSTGLKNLKSEDFYGLALALGGFEIDMERIVDLYSMLANLGEFKDGQRMISKESAFLTINMLEKNKDIDENPEYIRQKRHKIAFKTGTSYSYKDAWTFGIFGDYVLGVWIGNFDGEPNPAFVGRKMATPLFFEIARYLMKNKDFVDYDFAPELLNLKEVDICEDTFDLAGAFCKKTVKSLIIPMKSPIKVSKIHREIPIDIKTGKRACIHENGKTVLKIYEIWPSDIVKIFENRGIYKKSPPPFLKDCLIEDTIHMGQPPEIIYPTLNLKYMVDKKDFDKTKIPFMARISNDAKKIFWFVNNSYIGEAKKDEPLLWKASLGIFDITAVDDFGRQATVKINVGLTE